MKCCFRVKKKIEAQPTYIRCPGSGFSFDLPGVNAGVLMVDLVRFRARYAEIFERVKVVFPYFACSRGLGEQNFFNSLQARSATVLETELIS